MLRMLHKMIMYYDQICRRPGTLKSSDQQNFPTLNPSELGRKILWVGIFFRFNPAELEPEFFARTLVFLASEELTSAEEASSVFLLFFCACCGQLRLGFSAATLAGVAGGKLRNDTRRSRRAGAGRRDLRSASRHSSDLRCRKRTRVFRNAHCRRCGPRR